MRVLVRGVMSLLSLSSSDLSSVERFSCISSLSCFSTFSSRVAGTWPARPEVRPALETCKRIKRVQTDSNTALSLNYHLLQSVCERAVLHTSEGFHLVVKFCAGRGPGIGQPWMAAVQAGSVVSVSGTLQQHREEGKRRQNAGLTAVFGGRAVSGD